MQTLEEQFNARLNAFLGRTGLSPTTLGMMAVGDPSLLRQIERGRSPSLRTADRILAFMAAYEPDSGAARAPPGPPGRGPRRARRARRARKANRSGAMRKDRRTERTKPAIRFLRISAVEALTGLSRTTIYDWSADGRFPRAVRLSERAVRWIESEVEPLDELGIRPVPTGEGELVEETGDAVVARRDAEAASLVAERTGEIGLSRPRRAGDQHGLGPSRIHWPEARRSTRDRSSPRGALKSRSSMVASRWSLAWPLRRW